MPRTVAVPEVLDVKLVQYVKQVFQKADVDGGGDLDEDEFVTAFTGRLNTDEGSDKVSARLLHNRFSQIILLDLHIVAYHAAIDTCSASKSCNKPCRTSWCMQECMRKLFYRIDANGDGAIDWDEFSLFMLLENQGSAAIRKAEEMHVLGKPQHVPSPDAHKKLVQCCTIIPPCGGSSHRYVTGGRDGIVKLWNCKVRLTADPFMFSLPTRQTSAMVVHSGSFPQPNDPDWKQQLGDSSAVHAYPQVFGSGKLLQELNHV